MRANVLNDPALVKMAGQFAWLSVDSDQPTNEAFVNKFATGGVPLFVVIDPKTGKAVLNWYGTATAQQLVRLLEDSKEAMAGGMKGADALLARADEFNGEKKPGEAADLYGQALEMGGKSWAHRTRDIESLVMADQFSGRTAACIKTAAAEAPSMARDRSFVNTVYFGLGCAKAGSPELHAMEKLAEQGVKIPGVLGDDTSSLYEELAYTYRRDKEEQEANRVATDWLHYLQQQIAQTPTAEGRMGYDLHLVNVSIFLHKPEIALPEIERTEKELPGDYNPPRLAARLYEQMGRHDDALTACNQAIEKGYGAPKASLYATKAQILTAKGDREAAQQAYADGIAFAKTLPEPVAKPIVERLEKAAAKK